MLDEFRLDGKVAVVTGAGRGIGKGIALLFAEAGASIVGVDKDLYSLDQLASEVRSLGQKCLPVEADVTSPEQVGNMTRLVISDFGKVDILVNNAGIRGADKPVIPLPEARPPQPDIPDFYSGWSFEDWHELMSTNLYSVFICTRAIGTEMVKRREGRIINIASSWAYSGSGSLFNVPYCTAKAAIVRFTEALAFEWAKYGVNINAIGPGLVQTQLSEQRVAEVKEMYLDRIPLGRLGTPREIGLLAVYLASPASRWMTGQIIYLNGGETIG